MFLTGRVVSRQAVCELFKTRGAASLSIGTLLDKKAPKPAYRRVPEVEVC